MSAIHDIVHNTLTEWNRECERQGMNFTYEVKTSIRKKKSYINKNDFIESEIAELLLLHKKKDIHEEDLLLFRKELIVIPKQKHESIEERDRSYLDLLYRHLIYEMLGVFCVTTKQTIINRDYAEYDIDNDRLKQHESAIGMVVRVQTSGPFFEAGNEFDVFMDTEGEYYAVYTQHEVGKKNNGIARLPKADCLIIEEAKKKIILL